jgi:transposase-like protein
VAATARPHQRREAVWSGQLRARALLEQLDDDVRVATLARQVERAPALVGDRRVEEGLRANGVGAHDVLHASDVPLLRGEQQVGAEVTVVLHVFGLSNGFFLHHLNLRPIPLKKTQV